ncbi:MAG: flagellar basal body-associated FliL family protein [Sedimenticola sp.]|nr:flagellar basal body-associated FliL family protein [Sedimenticola sp.]
MRLTHLLLILSLFAVPIAHSADDEKEKDEEEPPKVALYHELSPSLVMNVQGRARYMRCDVQLMTYDEEKLANIVLHAPALRHALLLLFSDQQGQDIKDNKGKEKLRKAALKTVQEVMKKMTGDEAIVEFYFTAYFVE